MWTEHDLLEAVAGHIARTGESEAGFGRRVAGDPNLIGDIRRGRSPRLRLARRIIAACGNHDTETGAEGMHETAIEERQ